MSQRLLNIALVGCGGVAAHYRHRYTEIPSARLAIVIDIDDSIAKQAAYELNVEQWSTDFDDALAPHIDLVDISTPNFLHAPQAVKAMMAGKSVILQKPIAPTVEEAQLIVDTAVKTGVKAGMYMNMLDYPIYHDIKKMVQGRYLGKISSVYCRGAGTGGLNAPPGTWRSSVERTGGGALIQKTIHFINLAQWLLEEKICRVAAFSKNIMCPNIGGDDITNAVCEFESGIHGTLEGSYISAPHMIAVYGTKGYVVVIGNKKVDICLDDEFHGDMINYDRRGELMTFRYDEEIKLLNKKANPYDQHVAFVQAVMQGKKVPVSLETGLYDLKVVHAVYKAAREKRVVEVE